MNHRAQPPGGVLRLDGVVETIDCGIKLEKLDTEVTEERVGGSLVLAEEGQLWRGPARWLE